MAINDFNDLKNKNGVSNSLLISINKSTFLSNNYFSITLNKNKLIPPFFLFQPKPSFPNPLNEKKRLIVTKFNFVYETPFLLPFFKFFSRLFSCSLLSSY